MLSQRLIVISLSLAIIVFLLLKPAVSFASGLGLTFKTEFGTFFIPSNNPIFITVFPKKDPELEKIVRKRLDHTTEFYGIVIKNFTTGQEYFLNAADKFATASVYKIMLMSTIYEMSKRNEIEIDKNISDRIYNMITVSSNEDAWYLADRVGWSTIQKFMSKSGLVDTTMGIPPTTTPKDVLTFLEKLKEQTLVDKKSSLEMYKIMQDQKINDRLPRLLPKNTKIAHKTGELDDVRHDVGIVDTGKNVYAIILMSKNVTNEYNVKETIAKLSKEIYDYFENQWKTVPSIL